MNNFVASFRLCLEEKTFLFSLEKFSLSPNERFRYLNHSNSLKMMKTSDLTHFHQTQVNRTEMKTKTSSRRFIFQHAMNVIGLSMETQFNLFSLLIGILHLGNVEFLDENNGAVVESQQSSFCFVDFKLILFFIFRRRTSNSESKLRCSN